MEYKLVSAIVVKQLERDLEVRLSTGQKIIAARCNPLDLDEREQKPNVKNGTEILCMVNEKLGVVLAVFSIAQGIKLANEIYRIEREEIQLYGKRIKLMDSSGDNKDTVEKIADYVDAWTKKIAIRNETVEVIDNWTKTQEQLIALADAVASLKTVVASGSSAGQWSHSVVSDASSVSTSTAELKDKLLTLKK